MICFLIIIKCKSNKNSSLIFMVKYYVGVCVPVAFINLPGACYYDWGVS
jgi:hypothetical protein